MTPTTLYINFHLLSRSEIFITSIEMIRTSTRIDQHGVGWAHSLMIVTMIMINIDNSKHRSTVWGLIA